MMSGVWLGLLLPTMVLCQHVVELKQRTRSPKESLQLLEMLEYSEGKDRDLEQDRPVIKLDSTFFGEIGVGSPRQNFKVVFDTGSSVVWIYDKACTTCDSADVVKHKFDSKQSTTYKTRDTPFSIRYGTGESKGDMGADEFFLADLEVKDQAFGRCNQPDEVMRSFPFDGIVGLSRALVRDPNVMPTIIKTIKDEHLLESKDLANTFGFYIGREEGDSSYLILGGSHHMLEEEAKNTQNAKGVHWVPTLNKNIYWEIPLDDVFIHPRPGSNGPSGVSLEEHAVDPASEDAYAIMGLDPEVALLEVEEALSRHHVTPKHAKQQRHKTAHPQHAHSTKHAMEEDVESETVEMGLERNMQVKAHTFKPGAKKAHTGKASHAKGTTTTSNPHAKRAPTHNTAAGVAVDSSGGATEEIGTGQLLSSMHSSPGNSLNACQQDDEHMCIVSVDSGHSLMSGPPDIIRTIKKALSPPNPEASCDEKTFGQMPDISFAMGGKLFTLKPEDYLIELQGKCVPAFSERTVRNGHDWVLGEHFMRTFYSVFDYDNMRVGFSHLDHVTPHLDKIMKGSNPGSA